MNFETLGKLEDVVAHSVLGGELLAPWGATWLLSTELPAEPLMSCYRIWFEPELHERLTSSSSPA